MILQKSKQPTASFLILLILSLPIYSSSASALLINPRVLGSDNVKGFVQANESITLKVIAQRVGGAAVIADHVLLGTSGAGGQKMQGCTSIGSGFFECASILSSAEIPSEVFNIPVYLLETDGITVNDQATFMGVVDKYAPIIRQFDISPTLIREGEMLFEYDVQDVANNFTTDCVGLKTLTISHNTFEQDVGIAVPPCRFDSSFKINISEITSSLEDNITILATATDKLNQVSTSHNVTVEVDRTGPRIKVDSFKLFDQTNQEITFLTDRQAILTAKLTIEDPRLNLSSVIGDFIQLNETNIPNQGSCLVNPTDVVCTWVQIKVNIESDTSKTIIINASDNLGNKVSKNIQFAFNFDTGSPSVQTLVSDYQDSSQNNYFGTFGNNLTMVIEEDGIGLAGRQVFVDLTAVNGNSKLQADTCSLTNNAAHLWTCIWKNIPVTGADGIKQIFLTDDSQDDLGLKFAGTTLFDITIDTTPPAIMKTEFEPEFPRAPFPLIVFSKVQEASELEYWINASRFSGDQAGFPKRGSCVPYPGEPGFLNCSVAVLKLMTEPANTGFNISVIDITNNEGHNSKSIQIFQSAGNVSPECLRSDVSQVIPTEIDKRVTDPRLDPPLNVDAFVYTLLTRLDGCQNLEILDMSVECPSMEGNLLSAAPYLENDDAFDPFIALKLSPTVGTLGTAIPIDCTIAVNIKNGNKVYELPEQETITTTIGLYGNSFGELDENVQKEIDTVTEDIKGLNDKIKDFDLYMNIFGTWCSIAQIMGRINSLAQAIKFSAGKALAAAFIGCTKLTIGAPACMKLVTGIWRILCTISSFTHKFTERYFWPSGFPPFITPLAPDLSLIIGMFSKYGCMIAFNCAACDMGTWVNVGITIAGTIAQKVSGGSAAQRAEKQEEAIKNLYDKEIQGDAKLLFKEAEKTSGNSLTFDEMVAEARLVTPLDQFKINMGFNVVPWIDQTTGRVITSHYFGNVRPDKDFRSPAGEIFRIDANGRAIITKPVKTGTVNKWLNKNDLGGLLGPYSTPKFDQTIPTPLPDIQSNNWVYDPYKSYHYAKRCFCIPPLVYNYKKEVQLSCLLQNCLKNHLQSGTSTNACYDAHRERKCLYLESAQWKLHGLMDDFFGKLVDYLWENMPSLVASFAYSTLCKPYMKSSPSCSAPPIAAAYNWACGVSGALVAGLEMDAALGGKWSFNVYEDHIKELTAGGDFCSSEDSFE